MTRTTPLPAALSDRGFRVAEARAAGVTPSRLRAGDLAKPFHGVRMPATFVGDVQEVCRAYAGGRGTSILFSHVTAAKLHGIPLPWRLQADDRIHELLVGGSRAPRGRGVVGHKTAVAPASVRRCGVALTDPIDTLISLADILSLDELILAGDRLVGLPNPPVGYAELVARVDALVGVRGAKRLRAAMSEIRPGSRSPRETRARLAIVRAGLPEPSLNAEIRLDGMTVHGDLVYEHLKIVLEYEGDQHRTDDLQWSRDLRRYNALSEAGWIALRISRHMSPAEIVAAVRRALRIRGVAV